MAFAYCSGLGGVVVSWKKGREGGRKGGEEE